MARIGLRVGIACYTGGLFTAIAGLAVALKSLGVAFVAVVATGVLVGLVAAVVLPTLLDPAFVRTTDDWALLVPMFTGLGIGLGAPYGALFLDVPFPVEAVLVGGGLVTLLGHTVTWEYSQRAWIERLIADSERVVEFGPRTRDRWLRVAGVVVLLGVVATVAVALDTRSYTTVIVGYIGVLTLPGLLWPRREAVLTDGLLKHQLGTGVATLAEWDLFESYSYGLL